jgi:hypothetical protein
VWPGQAPRSQDRVSISNPAPGFAALTTRTANPRWGKKMISSRLVLSGVVAGLLGLAGFSIPAKADPVMLRCEKFQDSSQGVPVMFVKVDFDKNDFYIKSYSDENWKAFKEAKLSDDVIQIQDKRWVDRSTGVLKWDFATYQCQTTRPKVF